jgi:hypothetical protein
MTHFNRIAPVHSACKLSVLLALALLFAAACVVNAQDNTNNTNNSNTGNINANNRNNNAAGNTNNGNGNTNSNNSNNNSARGDASPTPSPTPNAEQMSRQDTISKSYWYPLVVTLIFGAVVLWFASTIVRAIRFSRSTFNSPLGLPEGSLRAMLAFMLVAFLGFYVYAGVLSMSPDFKPPDFLLGIVATVIGFYFGSRTGEDKGTTTSRTGTVSGAVRDKTGAVTPEASVELSQQDGKKLTQKADAKGAYKFDNVPAGDYDVQAALPPHAPSDPMKVKVAAGATLKADLTLK